MMKPVAYQHAQQMEQQQLSLTASRFSIADEEGLLLVQRPNDNNRQSTVCMQVSKTMISSFPCGTLKPPGRSSVESCLRLIQSWACQMLQTGL